MRMRCADRTIYSRVGKDSMRRQTLRQNLEVLRTPPAEQMPTINPQLQAIALRAQPKAESTHDEHSAF